MYDFDDDRMFVVESAIKNKLGSREEIELFEELSLALELMEDDSFKIAGTGIGGGLDFSIVTQYPDGLPEKIGLLFFGISTDFDDKCQETSTYAENDERHFQIKIKKV